MARLIDADALMKELPVHPEGGMRSIKNESLMIRVRETVKNAPTIGGWISVKDRLPDVKDNVLWYAVMNDGYGEIRISSFSGTINHDIPHVWGFGESFKPIYWMPLPEKPKEEPQCQPPTP